MVRLAGNLLAPGKNGVQSAKIDNRRPAFMLSHHARNQIILHARVFFHQHVSLSFSNFLDDHLLGRLSPDPTNDFLVVERLTIDPTNDPTFFTIDHKINFGLFAIMLFGCRHQSRFNRPKHQLFVNALLAMQ